MTAAAENMPSLEQIFDQHTAELRSQGFEAEADARDHYRDSGGPLPDPGQSGAWVTPPDVAAQAEADSYLIYDSVDTIYPAGATHIFAYADGEYVNNPLIVARYPFVHSITVLGSRKCLIDDYEPGNPTFDMPGLTRQWTEERIHMAPPGERGRAVEYCDRADLRRLQAELGLTLWNDDRVLFWIPTLDGRFWTAAELAYDIAHNWGVFIPQSRIWATQGLNSAQSGGPWDTSKKLNGAW